jgi:exopolysaccharide biosynthesis polyprenyl glycosylphosphotransferase
MNDQMPSEAQVKISSWPAGAVASASAHLAEKNQVGRQSRSIYKRAVGLIIGDLLVVNAMLFFAEVGRANLEPTFESIFAHSYWFISMSVLWLVCGAGAGIYTLPRAFNWTEIWKPTLATALIVSFLSFLIPVIMPSLPPHRSQVVQLLALMLSGPGLWRLVFTRCFSKPVLERKALVIGAGWAGSTLAETFSEFRGKHNHAFFSKYYKLLGFIDDDSDKEGKVIHGLRVLGNNSNLLEVVKKLRPDELVLAITRRSDLNPELFQAILRCRELGVSIVPMQALYERLTQQVPLEHSGTNLDVIMPLFPSIGVRFYSICREIADIASAIPGMIFLGLMIPVVWLANRLTSPGPIFYRQERVGKSGETFTLVKFRSMVVDAEKTGGVWAKENDDRITPIGRILRKSRLDELPQFWNILKGDMSLIGPRPERPGFVELLEKEIPFYRLRHAVKPGITGWAQVKYRYGASAADAFVKLRYDFYYIKNQSILLDLEILLRTVGIVVGFRGR